MCSCNKLLGKINLVSKQIHFSSCNKYTVVTVTVANWKLKVLFFSAQGEIKYCFQRKAHSWIYNQENVKSNTWCNQCINNTILNNLIILTTKQFCTEYFTSLKKNQNLWHFYVRKMWLRQPKRSILSKKTFFKLRLQTNPSKSAPTSTI